MGEAGHKGKEGSSPGSGGGRGGGGEGGMEDDGSQEAALDWYMLQLYRARSLEG